MHVVCKTGKLDHEILRRDDFTLHNFSQCCETGELADEETRLDQGILPYFNICNRRWGIETIMKEPHPIIISTLSFGRIEIAVTDFVGKIDPAVLFNYQVNPSNFVL